jgi:hypothetical protein
MVTSQSRPSARWRVLGVVTLLILLSGVVTPTFAGSVSSTVLTISAVTNTGQGTLTIPFDEMFYDAGAGIYDWSLEAPLNITDNQGHLLATVMGLNTYIEGDPLLSVNFLIRAGAANVQLDITSATLMFDTLDPAEGVFSSQIGGTDMNGNGVAITGMFGGGKSCVAHYNVDQTFATIVDSQSAGAWGSTSKNETYPASGMTAFPAPVSSIWSEISFGLTARDMASGTGVYTVIPEPQTIALLLLGSLLSLRKR